MQLLTDLEREQLQIRLPSKHLGKETVMIVPFVGSFHKDETIVSGVEKKDSIELYRYLFFTITYGENGMRAEIQQSTGGSIQVQPEDVLSQRFHVFIAFVSHPDTTYVNRGART